jgi:putative hydrolase of the HAD superfamily
MYKNFFDGYEAVFFDLNGTIVNDEEVWQETIERIFSPEIINDSPYYGERGEEIRGKIHSIVRRNEFRSYISEDSYYELIFNDYFNNIESVTITPGFEEFANFLKGKGRKLVLITNSDYRITHGILEKKNLKKYFDLILTSDDINYPKPAPDIYKLALAKLNLKKENVIVFEDSINGAIAAEKANLKIIVILPDEHKPSDYGSKNRLFIDNFETILETIDQDFDTYIEDIFSK